jgi:hypothetical protein
VRGSMANKATHRTRASKVASVQEGSDIDWDEISIAQQILILRRRQLESPDAVLGTVAGELQKTLVSRANKKRSRSENW